MGEDQLRLAFKIKQEVPDETRAECCDIRTKHDETKEDTQQDTTTEKTRSDLAGI